jgi:agmatine deiminase
MNSPRLPAEWERHRATLIACPHNPQDWPGKHHAVSWAFAEIVRHIAVGEDVLVVVQDSTHESRAQSLLTRAHVELERVSFFRVPLDRGWLRDCAPFFVKRGKTVEARPFGFNAWARYDNWQLDAAFGGAIAAHLELPVTTPEFKGGTPILEGGGIESNGEGTLIVTEEWLLDPNRQVRNPGYTREDYEALFRAQLGAKQTLWIGRGIVGDDTHGHIDDCCRFVNAHTAVLAHEARECDPNHARLRENRERLEGVTLANGSKLDVVNLPMPAPLYFGGIRLPASYANFYIVDHAVLVPTFNDPNDRIALGLLAELMPGRTIVGIHAVDLIWGFGAVHCLTHEVPA